MPRRAPLPCPEPGCPVLTQGGRCPAHRKADYRRWDEGRGTAHQRLYDARWQRYSRRYLREHPLCVVDMAAGRTVPSEATDHIVPHRGDVKLFWDPSNHQALCKLCHDRKTAGEVNQRIADRKHGGR